jgi:hypothetical protein
MKRLAVYLSVAAAVAASIVSPGPVAAAGIQPLPPGEISYGMKLVDWATAWSQWLMSIPQVAQPDTRYDKTGLRGGVGQHKPVWFLPAPTPGLSGTRTFFIPDGQAILLCPTVGINFNDPGVSTDEDLIAGALNPPVPVSIAEMEVSLDGIAVQDIKNYRVTTPVFTIVLPPGNLAGASVTVGKDHRVAAAADGYWMLFPPLPVGAHVVSLHLEGTDPDGKAYKSDWTFNLAIQKPNEPLE